MEEILAPKSCFVVAPPEAAIAPFLEELRKHRIEPFFISDFLKSGKLAISQLRSAFRSVDLVIAFLVSGHPLTNVSFEIGIAVGVGRPILIFAEPGVPVPIDFAGMGIRAVDFSNLRDLIAEVETFLEPRPKEAGPSIPRSNLSPGRIRSRLRDADLRTEIRRIQNVFAHLDSSTKLESEVSRLLSTIGWTVAEARPSVRTQAPDLAVWIDEIQKDIGNPLAVEVKSALRPDDLNSVVAQLSRYLTSVGARAGVVLYAGPKLELRRNVAQSSPPIFAFSLDEFTSLIEGNQFPAALKASLAAAKQMD